MTNANERRLLRVLDRIHDHPTRDLSLDALSDIAAMSRFHWHWVFQTLGTVMASRDLFGNAGRMIAVF